MFNLESRTAIVTGASSGLGADAARGYAENGANVALLARRKEKLDALAEELAGKGVQALAVQCDVADESSVKAAVETVAEQFGRIDILLNNAGIAFGGSVDTLSREAWQQMFDINVDGIFLMCKYVVPHMKSQQYGRIVNVSSINAFVADVDEIFVRHAYNASKQAVLGLSLGMAASYGRDNITVNTICPGFFETEMTEKTLLRSKKYLSRYNELCPIGRIGEKGELNGPILFFSSESASYTTGQYLIVDGGFTLV